MALATRENSGLVVKVDRKGQMHLYVHGKRVVAFSVKTESHRPQRGVLTVEIPTQAVTFENVDDDPIAHDPLTGDFTNAD